MSTLPDESGFVRKALVTVDDYIFKILVLSDESEINIYEACIGFGIHFQETVDEGKINDRVEVRLMMPDGYRAIIFKLVGKKNEEEEDFKF